MKYDEGRLHRNGLRTALEPGMQKINQRHVARAHLMRLIFDLTRVATVSLFLPKYLSPSTDQGLRFLKIRPFGFYRSAIYLGCITGPIPHPIVDLDHASTTKLCPSALVLDGYLLSLAR